jgi:(p)ppGpp synthase/HD superfamily hydrolase
MWQDYVPIVVKAKAFAEDAHKDQMYGNIKYIYHLMEVRNRVCNYGETCEILAYLHDIVEDTNISLEEIQKEFGEKVAECVYVITDPKGKNRKERKSKSNIKLSFTTIKEVLIVKPADRLSNTINSLYNNEGLFEMYKKEYPAFRAAVHREGLCDDLWEHLDRVNKMEFKK